MMKAVEREEASQATPGSLSAFGRQGGAALRGVNQLHLTAQIESLGQLRYTPPGSTALDCNLKAESRSRRSRAAAKVSLEIKAVVVGELVKATFQGLGVGKPARFSGSSPTSAMAVATCFT